MKNKITIQTILDLFLPLFIYYLVSNVALYLLNGAVQYGIERGKTEGLKWLVEHAAAVSVADNGIAMMIGGLCLQRYFLQETCCHGQRVAVKPRRLMSGYLKEGWKSLRRRYTEYLPVLALAVTSSLTLNLLAQFGQAALYSETYRQVAAVQYAVPFPLGLIAYGLVSPVVEEVVFRGVLYNKCRRYFGVLWGVLISSLMFAVLHGNLIQGVYAFFMGILIAGMYERYESFFVPVLFHAAANIAVFTLSYYGLIRTNLIAVISCLIFATISISALFFICRRKKN